MDQNRKSRMEKAEGSRMDEFSEDGRRDSMRSDSMRNSERMRNRESASGDLGSSSDRAMMTGRSSESRPASDEYASGPGSSSERGRGSSRERNLESAKPSPRDEMITNRDLGDEQDEVRMPEGDHSKPERGRSKREC